MLGGLVGQKRRMDAAKNDGVPAGAQLVGDRITAQRRPRNATYANQVGFEVQVQRLHSFVLYRQLNIKVVRNQSGERCERERRVAQRALEDPRGIAVDFTGRQQKLNLHWSVSTAHASSRSINANNLACGVR